MNKEIEHSYLKTFELFQKRLLKTISILIVACVLLELCFLPYFIQTDTTLNISEYIKDFLLKPTFINLLIFILGKLIYSRAKTSELIKGLIPIIMLVFMCGHLVIIHCTFAVIYPLFIIPIFVSIVYGNEKIETIICFLTSFCMTFAFIYNYIHTPDSLPDRYVLNVALTYALVVLAHLIAIAIIEYEQRKEKVLESNVLYNKSLEDEILHDGLTDLYNHTALFNYLNEVDKNKPLNIAVIDIDLFKSVNDNYGHETGNVVLLKIAELLKNIESDKIIPARYGGEEFAVVFSGYEKDEAFSIIDNLRIQLSSYKFEEMPERKVTFSAGIASYSGDIKPGEFFEKADNALYKAKSEGRNNVQMVSN